MTSGATKSKSRMPKTAEIYNAVPGLNPVSTSHNLSHQVTATGDMGRLYPWFYHMAIPGDQLNLGAEIVLRFMPHLAPLMHEVKAEITYFFVPYRLLWQENEKYNRWELYFTGAVNGAEIEHYNESNPDKPVKYPDIRERKWNPHQRWDIKGEMKESATKAIGAVGSDYKVNGDAGTIWEAIGLPHANQITDVADETMENLPVDFVKRAYNQIYQDWYRDQNIETRAIDQRNDSILTVNWEKDRFTSAGYDEQKGKAPAIPLSGQLEVLTHVQQQFATGYGQIQATDNVGNFREAITYRGSNIPYGNLILPQTDTGQTGIMRTQVGVSSTLGAENLFVDLSSGNQTFTINSLRLAAAMQKALEIDMRTGSRYFEKLRSRFNTAPASEVLQRADYIGRDEIDVIMGEVLQTSGTEADTALGEMAGHGMAYSQGGKTIKYYAQEHGVVLGLFVVRPKTQYQNGITRSMIMNSVYDLYMPEFAYLGEEGIYNAELYYTGNTKKDMETWAYQGIYDWMRIDHHRVVGLMRGNGGLNNPDANLAYWNLARNFQNLPNLTREFTKMEVRKDWLVITDEPTFIVALGFKNMVMRKMPSRSTPGMLDHAYGEGTGQNMMPRTGTRL